MFNFLCLTNDPIIAAIRGAIHNAMIGSYSLLVVSPIKLYLLAIKVVNIQMANGFNLILSIAPYVT